MLLRATLRAGVLIDDQVRRAVTGTPQGGWITTSTWRGTGAASVHHRHRHCER